MNEELSIKIANFITLKHTVANIEDISLYDEELDCEIKLLDIINGIEESFRAIN